MVETVEFNGVKFRRYPNAKQRADRVYFTPNGTLRAAGMRRLHEEIWMAANGPIPEGGHIHHIDGDPSNNAVDNLEWLPVGDHLRHHHEGVCTDAQRANLERIRPLTKQWHASDEGREWHRQQATNSYAEATVQTMTCEQCGKPFESKPMHAAFARFCSNNCKSAHRRASGVDDVDRVCVICGVTFRVSRYARTKTCSLKCGGRASSATKTLSREARQARVGLRAGDT